MTIYKFKNDTPSIAEGVFIADSADVIGRVHLAEHANLWFNVVARGDINDIHIGANTNIQDLSMLHVVEEFPLKIGSNVSVGHQVTLHACNVEDSCLIGMGAVVLDGAHIGESSVVAAGSLVPPGKKFPGGVMIMGSPAKIVRDLRPDEIERYSNHYKSYLITKEEYLNNLSRSQ